MSYNSEPSLCIINGTLYVAYKELKSGMISVSKYENGKWSYVGQPEFGPKNSSQLSLSAYKNTLYLSYIDFYKRPFVKRFKDNAWDALENKLPDISCENPLVCVLNGEPYLLLVTSDYVLQVYQWSDSQWKQFGKSDIIASFSDMKWMVQHNDSIFIIQDGYSVAQGPVVQIDFLDKGTWKSTAWNAISKDCIKAGIISGDHNPELKYFETIDVSGTPKTMVLQTMSAEAKAAILLAENKERGDDLPHISTVIDNSGAFVKGKTGRYKANG